MQFQRTVAHCKEPVQLHCSFCRVQATLPTAQLATMVSPAYETKYNTHLSYVQAQKLPAPWYDAYCERKVPNEGLDSTKYSPTERFTRKFSPAYTYVHFLQKACP